MAVTNLDNIADVLRAAGMTVRETGGWQTRGYAQQDLIEIRGVLYHHTATNRAQFDRSVNPTLNMVLNGREDLAPPLCNLLFARDGSVDVVATGVANHAGRGSAAGIPDDMGNHYLIGIECESSGVVPWDWTPEQVYWAPRMGAALEKAYLQGLPPELRLQLGHKEYSSEGKIDPAGWPGDMDGLRAQINAVLDGTDVPAPPVAQPPVDTLDTTPQEPAKTAYEPDPHWVVEPGENLTQVAEWAGTDIWTLAEYNGIADVNSISVGEWIWPPVGQGTWTVDPGDSLSKIAGQYSGLTVDRLCFANGINDPDHVDVGVRLQIPLS